MSWLYYDDESSDYSYSYPEADDRSGEDDLPETEGDDLPESEEGDGEPVGPDDLSDDGDALASAGFGTDEDYGPCDGGDEW